MVEATYLTEAVEPSLVLERLKKAKALISKAGGARKVPFNDRIRIIDILDYTTEEMRTENPAIDQLYTEIQSLIDADISK